MKKLTAIAALIIALATGLVLAEIGGAEATVSTSTNSAVTGALELGWKSIRCTADTHYRQDGLSSTTATTTDAVIPANTAIQEYVSTNTRYLAFILTTGTGTCYIYKLNVDAKGVPPARSAIGVPSGVSVYASQVWADVFDGGALIGSTLNTAGPNVLGGQTTASGYIRAQDAGLNNLTATGNVSVSGTLGISGATTLAGLTAHDAGFLQVQAVKFTSTQITGEDGFEALTSGVHWQIGPGVNESFFGTGGAGPRTTGTFTAGGEITSGPEGYRTTTANTFKATSYTLDGGTAFQLLAGSMDFDAGVHTIWAVNDGGVYPIVRMMADGYMASRTTATLMSLYTNGINNPATYGGLCITRPFTVTRVSIYTSSTAGAGTNDVLRISDGTNNCEATFSCASDLNTTGAKIKSPSGNCAFAAGACLTISETTGGCTPDPTLKTLTFQGWHQ